MLILTWAVGAYGAGQERSIDGVLLSVVDSLSGTDRSRVSLNTVPCSGDGTPLDDAMQTDSMIRPYRTGHEAIERTTLASEMTKCSGRNSLFKTGDGIMARAEWCFISPEALAFHQALRRDPQAP